MKVKVAIAKGNQYSATKSALELIKDEVIKVLKEKKPTKILLKPNLVKFANDWLPITRKETVKAVVDFLNPLGDFEFILGEGTPTMWGFNTEKVFDLTSYWELEKEYRNLKLIDLNKQPQVELYKAKMEDGEVLIKVPKMILDQKLFKVSICKLKNHNEFLNTLSIKNFVQGVNHADSKIYMHAGDGFCDEDDEKRRNWIAKTVHLMHYNFLVGARLLYPDLAVIDCIEATEGLGPNSGGTRVNLGVMVVSTDSLSADIVGTKLMGYKVENIPYLDILRDERKPEIKIVGENVEKVKRNFKKYPDYKWMLIDKRKVLALIGKK